MHLFPEQSLGPGAMVLSGWALDREAALLADLDRVVAAAPFRHMTIPGGHRMSVAMTNCGPLGWVADRFGYRYAACNPESGLRWPPMPDSFQHLATTAATAAGFPDFVSDACLINRYVPGARLSLHQDKNESDYTQPIVSVSLGLPATFQFGGLHRNDPLQRVPLEHGDVVVWGREARLRFHGVLTLKPGQHSRLGAARINLTFRRAG